VAQGLVALHMFKRLGSNMCTEAWNSSRGRARLMLTFARKFECLSSSRGRAWLVSAICTSVYNSLCSNEDVTKIRHSSQVIFTELSHRIHRVCRQRNREGLAY
jgi:hypothetical protein